jgi:hypothetical protein
MCTRIVVQKKSLASVFLLTSNYWRFSFLDNSKSYEDMSTVFQNFCLPSIFHMSYRHEKLVSGTKLRRKNNKGNITQVTLMFDTRVC